eukprot:147958-Heterocapsa_arctica.AAC.1
MRRRDSSANRRVGIVATPSERVRKTSASKRILAAVPRGRQNQASESADESLARQILELESRPHSNPVPIRPTLHRTIADLPAVGQPSSSSGRPAFIGDRPPIDSVARTGARGIAMATTGQPHNPPAAINGSQSAPERPLYRSPPAGMCSPPPAVPGPYRPPGAPPPAVPGPDRPP